MSEIESSTSTVDQPTPHDPDHPKRRVVRRGPRWLNVLLGPLTRAFEERDDVKGWLLVAPTAFWLTGFLLIPLVLIVVISFATRGALGNVVYRFSLSSYRTLLDREYLAILIESVRVAVFTTTASFLLGYPLAYFITRVRQERRWLFLFLVLVPFWTNFLIRIFAWMILLRTGGVIETLLGSFGLLVGPLGDAYRQIQLYTPGAVLVGMVYEFLPFMVLPLYASLDKLDPTLLEAAADLGAPPWRAFLRVTLPLSLPGIVAGSVLVFVPAMGMFVVSDLMGGARSVLIGNLIQNQFLHARNWPLGSAASMVMLALTMVITLWYTRRTGFGDELVA